MSKNRLDNYLEMESLVRRKEDNFALKNLNGIERQIIVAIWLEERDPEIQKKLGLSRGQLNFAVAKLLKKFNRHSRVGLALAFERSRHAHCGKLTIWNRK
jgi:DNA-binding CsgD family transcriptional regulator